MSARAFIGRCAVLVFLTVVASGGTATGAVSQSTAGITASNAATPTANCSKYRTLSTRTPQGRSAANEVSVLCVEPDCQYHRGGTSLKLKVGSVLKQGDEISCDPDGIAALAFGDNSTVVLHNATLLRIAAFSTEVGVSKTEILLKMGEIAAKVSMSEVTGSDFQVKQTTATASAQGTTFTVLYDIVGRASVTSVVNGVVSVDPAKGGLPTVDVGAGKEVQVTSAAISPIAPIGKAGVPAGGVSRSKAGQLVLAQIAKNDERCKLDVLLFGLLPATKGWTVSAKVTGPKKGWAVWRVYGGKATPANPRATSIVAGCR